MKGMKELKEDKNKIRKANRRRSAPLLPCGGEGWDEGALLKYNNGSTDHHKYSFPRSP